MLSAPGKDSPIVKSELALASQKALRRLAADDRTPAPKSKAAASARGKSVAKSVAKAVAKPRAKGKGKAKAKASSQRSSEAADADTALATDAANPPLWQRQHLSAYLQGSVTEEASALPASQLDFDEAGERDVCKWADASSLLLFCFAMYLPICSVFSHGQPCFLLTCGIP